MTLKISDSLSLPLDAVTQTFGVLAVRGAGKSNTAAVMAEEMFDAGLPFVVIDPVGSWFGLRAGRDGKPKGGLPVPIFGGRHGDVPLERGAGELLADLVVGKRLSCVLDLSEFDSEAAKKQFLLAFAIRLYRKNESPLHLFLEEADDYIPQRPMRDEAHLLRAWENIVRRGRSRGLGITLITQRSASLNKSVLTQVETLFAMRTTGPQDRSAIAEWVKYHSQSHEILESLSGLKNGEAWAWSPHWLGKMERVQMRRRRTFDSGATPKHAKGAKPAASLADVDLAAVQKEMAATIEKAKADDPRELRKRIAALEKELAAKKPERVEVPVLSEEEVAGFLHAFEDMKRLAQDALSKIGKAELPLQRVSMNLPMPRITLTRSDPCPPQLNDGTGTLGQMTGLGQGERRILTAIAQYPAGVSRETLTVLTGYKRSSRDTYIQRLRSQELVEQSGDLLLPMPAAFNSLGRDFQPLPTGEALRRHWLEKLPEGEKNVFKVVLHYYPEAIDRPEIDAQTGYKRSSRDTYLQRLHSRRLVQFVGPGEVRASEDLFE
jgi:hypothetical protein